MSTNLVIEPTQTELSFLNADYIKSIESKLPCLLKTKDKYFEQTLVYLICSNSTGVYVVPLTNPRKFQHFLVKTSNHDRLGGLIYSNLKFEIDTEHFTISNWDANYEPGILIWKGSELILVTNNPNEIKFQEFTLNKELMGFGKISATFPKWQITIGEGREKKILWKTCTENTDN